jgi:hypothetical protein
MPILKSRSFIALPKPRNDSVQTRRTKFLTKLEEQKLLLKYLDHARPNGAGPRLTRLSPLACQKDNFREF